MTKTFIKSDGFQSFFNENKFLINSNHRLKILICLNKSPSTKKQVHEQTGLSYSAISGNLKQLIENDMIIENEGVYSLTNVTRTNLSSILHLKSSIMFLDKYHEYFNSHKIPENKINNFKDLASIKNMELIQNDTTDLYKVSHIFKEFFTGSNNIRSIFPFLHPKYDEILEDWLERDVGVKLIIPKEVSEAIINIISEYTPHKSLKNKYFMIKTADFKIDFVLIVSTKGVVLGFYRKDGSFDQNAVLISRDENTIKWAYEVYNEYERLNDDYISLENIIYKK